MNNPQSCKKSRNTLDSAKLSASAFQYERRFQRFELQCEARLKFRADNDLKEIAATSRNVSVGGFLLSAASDIPLHTEVAFFITIRSSCLVRPVHLTGTGRVVRLYSDVSDKSYAIAVECTTPIVQMEHYLPAIAFC
jgi:PilZ domain